MDPVTHTLVGATLAQTGLKRRTALGTATLLIGANIPDVDVLAYFWGGETALWFRRGVTHGVLALIVLPFILTGLMILWDRTVRRRRRGGLPAVAPGQLLLLAAIGIASHPLLDFMNSYGMRFLAPFSYRWFYGDALFIVDPWVWAALAVGFWTARRGTSGPKLALLATSIYVVVMAASNVVAREIVERSIARSGAGAERLMVAPLAVTPFTRWVVVEDAEGYMVGLFNWLPSPKVELARLPYDRDPADPAAADAVRERRPRRFLSWARFPYYLVQQQRGAYVVHIGDARYSVDPEGSWASTSVTIPAAAH